MLSYPAPEQLNDQALEAEICSTFARRDAESQRVLALIREHDARGTWCGWGIRSCAHWLMWRCGLGAGTAREKVRVARALGTLSTFDAMLRTGELSYSKVRAATRVATAENEAELARLAKTTTAAQLESVCQGIREVKAIQADEAARATADNVPPRPERWVRLKKGDSGMMRFEAQLHPDECALVMEAVEQARALRQTNVACDTAGTAKGIEDPFAETIPDDDVAPARFANRPPTVPAEAPGEPIEPPPKPTRADGLLALAERLLSTDSAELDAPYGRPGGERATLLVHLAPDILGKHLGGTLEDGSHVPAGTLRRIACDAGLVAVRTDESGHVLDIGRKTRTIPPAIRRALLIRDRRCRFPGCTHTRWLDAHHVEHWAHGGETKLTNLLLLCPLCRMRHNGHYAASVIMPLRVGDRVRSEEGEWATRHNQRPLRKSRSWSEGRNRRASAGMDAVRARARSLAAKSAWR